MGIRFLLVSGKPLEEPIAWHGPVVMNTEEELRQAFREIREGTFIKQSGVLRLGSAKALDPGTQTTNSPTSSS